MGLANLVSLSDHNEEKEGRIIGIFKQMILISSHWSLVESGGIGKEVLGLEGTMELKSKWNRVNQVIGLGG